MFDEDTLLFFFRSHVWPFGGGWRRRDATSPQSEMRADGARDAFLRGLALVFLVAFASFYSQIPGLYSVDGLEPAGRFLRRIAGGALPLSLGDAARLFQQAPTVLWFAPAAGACQ